MGLSARALAGLSVALTERATRRCRLTFRRREAWRVFRQVQERRLAVFPPLPLHVELELLSFIRRHALVGGGYRRFRRAFRGSKGNDACDSQQDDNSDGQQGDFRSLVHGSLLACCVRVRLALSPKPASSGLLMRERTSRGCHRKSSYCLRCAAQE